MMSARPILFSSSTSWTSRVLWPPASELMPTTWTSFSDGHARDFVRLLEQRADVHVEAQIGIGGGDDLGAAVMAVLAHLGDEDARTAALLAGELVGQPANLLDLRVLAKFGLINAGHRTNDSFVAVKDFFKREGNLPQRGARRARRQWPAPAGCPAPVSAALGQGVEGGLDFGVVAFGFEFLQALDLRFAHGGVVHFAKVELLGLFQPEQIHADDGFLAGINAGLAAGGGFLDAQLGQAGFDGLGHAAEGLDFLDVRPGAFASGPGSAPRHR